MSLNQTLIQKQTQKLIMTPDLRQSIELLPLSTQELAEKIQNELIENPLLEEIPTYEKPKLSDIYSVSQNKQLESREFNRNTDLSFNDIYSLDKPYHLDNEASNRLQKMIESSPVSENFNDLLLKQLTLTDLKSREIKIAEILISMFDENGFLNKTDDELSLDLNINKKLITKVLYYIHRLDPIGIGCRDIQHSLYVQAKILYPTNNQLRHLIKYHIKDIEKFEIKKICKLMKITEESVENLIKLIQKLKPFPASSYNLKKVDYIIPDIMIRETDGDFNIFINDEWIPKLKINTDYKKDLNQTKNPTDKEFLNLKINSANWLIRSINQRRITLKKVVSCIIDNQIDFFRFGVHYVKPMTLRDIAEKLNMHESTISRITTNKYIQTGWGIFELKWFFSSGVMSQSGNKESSRKIHDMIRSLVKEENENSPLSDQDIVDIMNLKGIEIARRTVAKYRKILKIPSANYRKKNKNLRGN
jgi:RNA polymerase sigma-54 factor